MAYNESSIQELRNALTACIEESNLLELRFTYDKDLNSRSKLYNIINKQITILEYLTEEYDRQCFNYLINNFSSDPQDEKHNKEIVNKLQKDIIIVVAKSTLNKLKNIFNTTYDKSLDEEHIKE